MICVRFVGQNVIVNIIAKVTVAMPKAVNNNKNRVNAGQKARATRLLHTQD